MNTDTAQKLADLAKRSEQQRGWRHARRPKTLASVLAKLVAKRGYGAVETDRRLHEAWAAAAGARLAPHSRAVRVSRGRLEVTVAHSPMLQEITFEKHRILAALREALPDAPIEDLRLRVGKL
ncbi:MAG: DUF721 domain-containing protein [Planctomycetota bacterium]